MKNVLLSVATFIFCITVSAQSASADSPFDRDDSLPTKSFKLLIDNVDHIRLTGDAKKGETLKPVLNELGELIAHAFGSLFGGDDEDEDFKSDIKHFDGNCDASGACFFVIDKNDGSRLRYSFNVSLNSKQEPVAVINNEVRLSRTHR